MEVTESIVDREIEDFTFMPSSFRKQIRLKQKLLNCRDYLSTLSSGRAE